MSYEHSEAFAVLKRTKDLKVNLTTYQWLTTLDFFIGRALKPILDGDPELAHSFFAKVLAFSYNNRARKFSTAGRDQTAVAIFNLLAGHQSQEVALKKMALNRGILLGFVSSYEEVNAKHLVIHDPTVKVDNRRYLLSVSPVPNVFWVAREVRHWHQVAIKFRELILAKYTRMTIMQAKSLYEDINHAIPLDDIAQTFMLCLARAVDRCDSNKGVLTTYINNWLMSARNEVIKAVSELHLNSDIADMDLAAANNSVDELMAALACRAKELDPKGVVRFDIGIPEFLTMQQKQILLNCK